MKRFCVFPKLLCFLVAITAAGLLIVPATRADIIISGFVAPADSDTWSDSTAVIIGYHLTGALSIANGSSISSYDSFIGYGSDTIGTVTVDGEGSTWSNYSLHLGDEGSVGSLFINNGGSVLTSYFSKIASTSKVTVDGKNSLWRYDAPLLDLDLDGILTINNGGSIVITYSDLTVGFKTDSDATVSVDGEGSTLSIGDSLIIGANGTGTLDITNGAIVSSYSGTIGLGDGSSGTVIVDGEGSTLSLNDDITVGFKGAGTLAITNGGSVTSVYGLINFGHGPSGTVTVDGAGSSWTIDEALSAGGYSYGSGTLSITNGGKVTSLTGELGLLSGSSGIVTVDGLGHYTSDNGDEIVVSSTWANSGDLYLGYYEGEGTLLITGGGLVTNSSGYFGKYGDARGTVTVDGVGHYTSDNGDEIVVPSTWANSGDLYLGNIDTNEGTGTLKITNGGLVTANSAWLNTQSSLTIDVGTGSALKVGTENDGWTGGIRNQGTISLVVTGKADSGTYTPMFYGTMDGDGIVQALGGTWDESAHAITVSDAITAQGAGGATATLDLAENQRVLITDSDTGMSVGASFLGTEASTEISLTATAVSGDDLLSLESLIAETGASILSAWNFSTEDYTVSTDTPVYLSLYANSATDLLDLVIWHLDDEWTEYDALDLAFDGTWASFVATGFSGYAVTATSAVPVPTTLWLLGSGLLCLVNLKRRMR